MDHFFNVTAGQILIFAALMGLLIKMQGFLAKLQAFHTTLLTEHEILIKDYCDRHDIQPQALPTRTNLDRKGGVFG